MNRSCLKLTTFCTIFMVALFFAQATSEKEITEEEYNKIIEESNKEMGVDEAYWKSMKEKALSKAARDHADKMLQNLEKNKQKDAEKVEPVEKKTIQVKGNALTKDDPEHASSALQKPKRTVEPLSIRERSKPITESGCCLVIDAIVAIGSLLACVSLF